VIEPLLARGKSVVIPPKSNRKVQRNFDKVRIPMIATTCSDASRYLFRLIATRGKAPLGSSADLSVRVYCQAAVKAVPVVNRRDPSANREVP